MLIHCPALNCTAFSKINSIKQKKTIVMPDLETAGFEASSLKVASNYSLHQKYNVCLWNAVEWKSEASKTPHTQVQYRYFVTVHPWLYPSRYSGGAHTSVISFSKLKTNKLNDERADSQMTALWDVWKHFPNPVHRCGVPVILANSPPSEW